MNSRKEINIWVFGCAMENSLKNNLQCLVIFWKCYFPTNFSHFLSYFLSFQKNFISENPPPPPTENLPTPTENPPLSTQNPPPHNTKTTKTPPPTLPQQQQKKIRDQREKDWKIEGKRDRSGKKDRSSAATTRLVLGGLRTRSILGGDDENKMQGDRRGRSWVFVDRWWGRVGWDEGSVMGVCAGAWLGGDEGSMMGVCAKAWLGGMKDWWWGIGDRWSMPELGWAVMNVLFPSLSLYLWVL